MTIIHHYNKFTKITICGKGATSDLGERNAVDLTHAIRQAEIMSLNGHVQLCRTCWQNQVEILQDMLTEPETEIVEEGE